MVLGLTSNTSIRTSSLACATRSPTAGSILPDTFAHEAINSTQMARRRRDSKAERVNSPIFGVGSISSFLHDLELLANGASGVKSFPSVNYCQLHQTGNEQIWGGQNVNGRSHLCTDRGL